MFYRRKIILSLLQVFDGRLEKVRLQKLLFLFTNGQVKPDYHFVPYKFGCYSFSANADLTAMAAKGLLEETSDGFSKGDHNDYLQGIASEDLHLFEKLKVEYGHLDVRALTAHTYIHYPFYATKSEVAAQILNSEQLAQIDAATPKCDETILFTIGYEGISLEEYLVRLLRHDVRVLVDVRNNPKSMKFGFSQNQLKKYCESLGIRYLHFPQVGIQSSQRQSLNSQADYDQLFTLYRKENLAQTKTIQREIFDLLVSNKRIALTCFEANICQCHRTHLADAIASFPEFKYEVSHI